MISTRKNIDSCVCVLLKCCSVQCCPVQYLFRFQEFCFWIVFLVCCFTLHGDLCSLFQCAALILVRRSGSQHTVVFHKWMSWINAEPNTETTSASWWSFTLCCSFTLQTKLCLNKWFSSRVGFLKHWFLLLRHEGINWIASERLPCSLQGELHQL